MVVKELLIQDGNNNASYPRTRTDVVRESPTLNARYNSPHPGKDYAVLDNVFQCMEQKCGTITIPHEDWAETSTGSEIWSVEVQVSGVTITSNSKIDIQPSPFVIKTLMDAGISSMLVSNDNGTVYLYAIGDNPNEELESDIDEVQVTVTKVFNN